MRSVAIVLLAACGGGPTRDQVDPRPPPVEVTPEALEHCDELERLEAAICRVETRMAIARERRDIVLLSCLNDKHQALVRLRGEASGERLGDVMTDRQITRLEREAEGCV